MGQIGKRNKQRKALKMKNKKVVAAPNTSKSNSAVEQNFTENLHSTHKDALLPILSKKVFFKLLHATPYVDMTGCRKAVADYSKNPEKLKVIASEENEIEKSKPVNERRSTRSKESTSTSISTKKQQETKRISKNTSKSRSLINNVSSDEELSADFDSSTENDKNSSATSKIVRASTPFKFSRYKISSNEEKSDNSDDDSNLVENTTNTSSDNGSVNEEVTRGKKNVPESPIIKKNLVKKRKMKAKLHKNSNESETQVTKEIIESEGSPTTTTKKTRKSQSSDKNVNSNGSSENVSDFDIIKALKPSSNDSEHGNLSSDSQSPIIFDSRLKSIAKEINKILKAPSISRKSIRTKNKHHKTSPPTKHSNDPQIDSDKSEESEERESSQSKSPIIFGSYKKKFKRGPFGKFVSMSSETNKKTSESNKETLRDRNKGRTVSISNDVIEIDSDNEQNENDTEDTQVGQRLTSKSPAETMKKLSSKKKIRNSSSDSSSSKSSGKSETRDKNVQTDKKRRLSTTQIKEISKDSDSSTQFENLNSDVDSNLRSKLSKKSIKRRSNNDKETEKQKKRLRLNSSSESDSSTSTKFTSKKKNLTETVESDSSSILSKETENEDKQNTTDTEIIDVTVDNQNGDANDSDVEEDSSTLSNNNRAPILNKKKPVEKKVRLNSSSSDSSSSTKWTNKKSRAKVLETDTSSQSSNKEPENAKSTTTSKENNTLTRVEKTDQRRTSSRRANDVIEIEDDSESEEEGNKVPSIQDSPIVSKKVKAYKRLTRKDERRKSTDERRSISCSSDSSSVDDTESPTIESVTDKNEIIGKAPKSSKLMLKKKDTVVDSDSESSSSRTEESTEDQRTSPKKVQARISSSPRRSPRSACQIIETSVKKTGKPSARPNQPKPSTKPSKKNTKKPGGKPAQQTQDTTETQKNFLDKLELTEKSNVFDKHDAEKENTTPPLKNAKAVEAEQTSAKPSKRGLPYKIRFSKTFVYSSHNCDSCSKVFNTNTDLQLHCLQHLDKRSVNVSLFRHKLPSKFVLTGSNEDRYLRAKESLDPKVMRELASKYCPNLQDSFSDLTADEEEEDITTEVVEEETRGSTEEKSKGEENSVDKENVIVDNENNVNEDPIEHDIFSGETIILNEEKNAENVTENVQSKEPTTDTAELSTVSPSKTSNIDRLEAEEEAEEVEETAETLEEDLLGDCSEQIDSNRSKSSDSKKDSNTEKLTVTLNETTETKNANDTTIIEDSSDSGSDILSLSTVVLNDNEKPEEQMINVVENVLIRGGKIQNSNNETVDLSNENGLSISKDPPKEIKSPKDNNIEISDSDDGHSSANENEYFSASDHDVIPATQQTDAPNRNRQLDEHNSETNSPELQLESLEDCMANEIGDDREEAVENDDQDATSTDESTEMLTQINHIDDQLKKCISSEDLSESLKMASTPDTFTDAELIALLESNKDFEDK